MTNGYKDPKLKKKKLQPYGGAPPLPGMDIGAGTVGSVATEGQRDPWGNLPGSAGYGIDPSHRSGGQDSGQGGGPGGLSPDQIFAQAGQGDIWNQFQQWQQGQGQQQPTEFTPADYSEYFDKLSGADTQQAGYKPPTPTLPGYTPTGYGGITPSTEVLYGDIVQPEAAGYGDTVAPPTSTPYGDILAPEAIPYQSSYSPEMWNKMQKEHMTGLQAGLMPGYELALKQSREEARQRVGRRSGLIGEAEEPIHTEFTRQMGMGASEFQKQKTGAQMADIQQQKNWEMQDKARISGAKYEQQLSEQDWKRQQKQVAQDRVYAQELDKAGWGRTENARVLGEEFQQSLEKAGWGRKESARVLGEQFAQKLDQGQWDRNQSVKMVEWDLDKAKEEGRIEREDYMNQWNVANTERLRKIDTARQDIQTELQLAVDANNFEKEKALRLELANISKEMAEAQANATRKAGESSGWGSFVGTAGGLVGTALIM